MPSPNPDRGAAYARFIPREELRDFSSWSPAQFGIDLADPEPEEQALPEQPAEPAGPTHEEWLEQVEAARHAGYEDGYRDGMAALESFKKTHADQMGQQLQQFVQSLDAEFDALHEQLAASVARTAVQLARQVVRSELQIAPDHVARVAAEAVEAVLRSARHITVHVHPLDLPLVKSGAAEVLQARGARVLAQPGIERGGCRVDSDAGAIDARIATRWTQAASALGSDEAWEDAGGDTQDGAGAPAGPATPDLGDA